MTFSAYLIAHLADDIGSDVGHLGGHVTVLGGQRLSDGEAGSAPRPAPALLITAAVLVLPETRQTVVNSRHPC